MAEKKTILMSASGNTRCEISIAHWDRPAVAWVSASTDSKYLACGPCADESQEVGHIILRDLRTGKQVDCTWCGKESSLDPQLDCADCGQSYPRANYHNCRNVTGEPYVVYDDEGRYKTPIV